MNQYKYLIHKLDDDKYSITYSREAGQVIRKELTGFAELVNNLHRLYIQNPIPDADYDRMIGFFGFKPSEENALLTIENLLQNKKQTLREEAKAQETKQPQEQPPLPYQADDEDIPF